MTEFMCLLASIASVKAEDVCATVLFMGDLIGHHQEKLGSITLDIATVSSFDQLVIGPIHARGATLDFLMTDVPELVASTGDCCSTTRIFRLFITLDCHFDVTGG